MKKTILICFGIFAIIQLSGCATASRKPAQKNDLEMKLQMQRFDEAKALSVSDIPEQYNASRLKQGSRAKVKYNYNNSGKLKGTDFTTDKLLREIGSEDGGKLYVIDITYGKNTITFRGNAASLARIIVPAEAQDLSKIRDHKSHSSNFINAPTAALQGALAAGPIGVIVNLAHYSNMKKIEEEMNQQLKDTKIESKIISFDLISNERLAIANQEIPCKVYQVKTLTRHIRPSTKSLPGFIGITDESKKVWISDEVPFGFVKSQSVQTFHMSVDSTGKRFSIRMAEPKSQEFTSEVVEFSY